MSQNGLKYCEGSKWRKWDLHFHTPRSYDYGNKSVTNSDIVETLVSNEIAVVAITDHNRIDIDRIQDLQKIAGDRLTILPGIELRTDLGGSNSIHIIGLFPETAHLSHIATTLQGQLDLTEATIESRGEDRVYVSFQKAATVISNLGGLVSVHAGKKSNSIESISNNQPFKMQLKADLTKSFVDIFELGKPEDASTYETKIFPHLGFNRPLIIGSDNHDINNYKLKIPTWLRCDPTFAGLRQIVNEPVDRVFLGYLPELLERVSQNKTKFIHSLVLRKCDGSALSEDWFDAELFLNPGLVAIIGNKGSGKSALADVLGLLGHTRHSSAFSFLNETKFKQKKNNKAKHFEAQLRWASGNASTKTLDAEVNEAEVETVQYIPQNFLETVCNELSDGSGRLLDAQLKSVIFSHVPEEDRLGHDSLDSLIQFTTSQANKSLKLLREDLSSINSEIFSLSLQLQQSHRNQLAAQLREKQLEISTHVQSKPIEVIQPTADPNHQSNRDSILNQIEAIDKILSQIAATKLHLEQNRLIQSRKLAVAKNLLAKIANFRTEFAKFEEDAIADANELNLDFKTLVSLQINTSPLEQERATQIELLNESSSLLEPQNLNSPLARESEQLEAKKKLSEQLDAPQKEYQEYLEKLKAWESKLAALQGSAEAKDTYAYLQERIKALELVPERLTALRSKQLQKSKEIYNALQELSQKHADFYKPAQALIQNHKLSSNGKITIDFEVTIVQKGIEEKFFSLINQNKRGSFMGVEEGRLALRNLLNSTDWNSPTSVERFLQQLELRLAHDFRSEEQPETNPIDQLKRDAELSALYDLIYGFSYLQPRYHLRWEKRDLDELSPGERGIVLLLFYLLVDKSSKPLIIDQPEENLDNQTVYNVLVPAIKDARKRRQIIIVTHNPNLAVVCDADQIIHASLDKGSRNKITYRSGSIENPEINKTIVDILEGTRPAFDNRDMKYHQRPT